MALRFSLLLVPVVFAAAVLVACETSPQGDPAIAESPATNTLSDLEIAASLYAGSPRTPTGFLEDPAPPSYTQVTTYHIKNQQLDQSATSSYEMCTDDWARALEWSETVALQAPVTLNLVTNTETERYYEFDRVPQDDPTHYVRMRVYRCGYLDRNGVDLLQPTDFAGTINQRPLNELVLGEFSEYLWRFTEYNNVDHHVLTSESRPAAAGLLHVLTLSHLERAADANECDRIRIDEWQLAADEASGELTLSLAPLRTFNVRRDGEAVLPCV